ncbi:MAG: hypothetical protein O2917_09640 [Acidobacteria bacterium]|nr:hypothetical protein [Acidobacteriota bacterium]
MKKTRPQDAPGGRESGGHGAKSAATQPRRLACHAPIPADLFTAYDEARICT